MTLSSRVLMPVLKSLGLLSTVRGAHQHTDLTVGWSTDLFRAMILEHEEKVVVKVAFSSVFSDFSTFGTRFLRLMERGSVFSPTQVYESHVIVE